MKKLICLLLALALVGALVACGPAEAPTEPDLNASQPTETEPQDDPTEPPTETEPSEDPTEPPTEPAERVSVDNQVDYTPEGEVTANVTDALNVTYTDKNGVECVCILPKIELPGPNVEAINAEILADYSGYIREDAGFLYRNIYYKWAVKGDILSVVIVPDESSHTGGERGYGYYGSATVYNISISKCRLISNEEVYAAAGIEDARTRVLHAAACHAGAWYISREEPEAIFGNQTIALMMLEMNIAQENFDRAKPYFNEDGKLCALTYVHTPAGAGYFQGDFCVEDYDTDTLLTAEEYYDTFAAQVN